jgi:hypothetical protein
MPPEQLRAELESAHREMLALLDSLDRAALDHRGHLSSGDEGSTEDNFRLVANHKRGHTADIRAALTGNTPSPLATGDTPSPLATGNTPSPFATGDTPSPSGRGLG